MIRVSAATSVIIGPSRVVTAVTSCHVGAWRSKQLDIITLIKITVILKLQEVHYSVMTDLITCKSELIDTIEITVHHYAHLFPTVSTSGLISYLLGFSPSR